MLRKSWFFFLHNLNVLFLENSPLVGSSPAKKYKSSTATPSLYWQNSYFSVPHSMSMFYEPFKRSRIGAAAVKLARWKKKKSKTIASSWNGSLVETAVKIGVAAPQAKHSTIIPRHFYLSQTLLLTNILYFQTKVKLYSIQINLANKSSIYYQNIIIFDEPFSYDLDSSLNICVFL